MKLNSFPFREWKDAKEFCKREHIRQMIVEQDQFLIKGFAENERDRCYHCKYFLFSFLKELAKKNHISCVADGTNFSDMGGYRPGLKALAELGVVSPLREAELTKEEIRALSKRKIFLHGTSRLFPVWRHGFLMANRSPGKAAPCRNGGAVSFEMGFTQFRVRSHDRMARIEIRPQEFPLLVEKERSWPRGLKHWGLCI